MKRSLKFSKTGMGFEERHDTSDHTSGIRGALANSQIDDILKTCKNKDIASDYNSGIKWVRKKTSEEIQFLEEMFQKDPKWGRKTVQICKKTLNLNTDQVYKWGYDKKLLLKKKRQGQSDPLWNRDIANQIKKEVFLTQDLNDYVSDIVDWFKDLPCLTGLNEVSATLGESEKLTVKNFHITKNLSLGSAQELCNEEGCKLVDNDTTLYPVNTNPPFFAPFHDSFGSLFDNIDTVSGSTSTFHEKEVETYLDRENHGEESHPCDLTENLDFGRSYEFVYRNYFSLI